MNRSKAELARFLAGPRLREADNGAPPAILGNRGSPLEAPENSLRGLTRALELGLDGIAYDVRASRDGGLVLLRDETLERTTDGHGPVAERTLAELALLDAGGHFHARFRDERLALLEEALALSKAAGRARTRQLVFVHERGLAQAIALTKAELAPACDLTVASAVRDTCFEARDAGLASPLLCVRELGEREERLVREERIAALGIPPALLGSAERARPWPCRRIGLGLDEPDDLLAACRAALDAFTTNEPQRALAVRALVRLAPADDGPFPIRAPLLAIPAGAGDGSQSEWFGDWRERAEVRNPFPFEVRATIGLLPRHGAFEIEGLPQSRVLAVGEACELEFTLHGGSWRPGGDPSLFTLYRWRAGPGRKAGALLLDAPLRRMRSAFADVLPQRLPLLCESPGDSAASLVLRRHRQHLLVSLEGGLDPAIARVVVQLDGVFHYGGRGVRALLPPDFDTRAGGVPFSAGVISRADGERRVRRWAGGVPDEFESGAPGRLWPWKRA